MANREKYVYEGPNDYYAKDANSEFVARGEEIELTDQEAVIAIRYGNTLRLLSGDKGVADRIAAVASGATVPEGEGANDADGDGADENDDDSAEDGSSWRFGR